MADSYEKILSGVREWVFEALKTKLSTVPYEITHDRHDCFRVVLYFEKLCIGEIAVSNAEVFAPFRYVRFEVLKDVKDVIKYVYAWYDKDSDNLDDILEHLNEGIEFIVPKAKNRHRKWFSVKRKK